MEVDGEGVSDLFNETESKYLAELLFDKKRISSLPVTFKLAERLLDQEILRVQTCLYKIPVDDIELPDVEEGVPLVSVTDKVWIPVREYPGYNFVGRVLGPGGRTLKQLECQTGCTLRLRGRGSLRDGGREGAMLKGGDERWAHLSEDLHVAVCAEDTEERARAKVARAVKALKRILVPSKNNDELKRRQLLELSILKGTFCETRGSRPLIVPPVLPPKPPWHQLPVVPPLPLLDPSIMLNQLPRIPPLDWLPVMPTLPPMDRLPVLPTLPPSDKPPLDQLPLLPPIPFPPPSPSLHEPFSSLEYSAYYSALLLHSLKSQESVPTTVTLPPLNVNGVEGAHISRKRTNPFSCG